jgi:phage terminase small subunit
VRASPDLTTCPRGFDTQSKRMWTRSRALLKAEGRWRPEYSPLLERYLLMLQHARHAQRRIDDREKAEPGTGYIGRGVQKQPVEHPDVKGLRAALREANDYARELLLTPAAREKMGEEKPKPGPGKFGGAFGAS